MSPVHTSAPCSPWRNCDIIHFCISMANSAHSLSPQLLTGVPGRSRSTEKRLDAALSSGPRRSRSTTVSQSRSVEPFHCEVLAFSYSFTSAGRLRR